jgi:GT2 family glycosyltransferase
MTVSIIIAVKAWNKNLQECVDKCRELPYPDFEIIVFPDSQINNLAARIIATGPLTPAKKRDLALGAASGEILAFIDDDAYPAKDWLQEAVKNFSDPAVAAVGGPAITPKEDSLRQHASGAIYSLWLASAGAAERYIPGRRKEVDDWPSCNFLVRKSVMQELGGFDTNFWPGEDTKLCLDITKKLGRKIIYDPRVAVYHHRRPVLAAHLRQVASYALHRGYFVKRFSQTSLRPTYFIPSLFLLGLAGGGLLAGLSAPLRALYLSGIIFYLLLTLIFSLSGGIRLAFLVFPGIVLTHLTYGLYFLKGLLSARLKEE